MNSAKPESCPDKSTLLQYIQGLLEPPRLGRCEEHVTDCQSCHETLRGLDFNDTLSHHVSDAIRQSPAENVSDTRTVDGLIQRLLKPENLHRKFPGNQNAPSEIMADKAAEVLRCIDPPIDPNEESLGTIGDYRLLKLIGAGGTGVVFQAADMSLDRIVALKILRPSLGEIARERFIAEARLAASIEHDNVVAIYQIGQQDRLAFIAMQWTPGETLEARLEREPGPMDEATAREFVSQIAAGLVAAHQRQLIHRDIKPANIWICDDSNRIKILDFGLARVADEESSLTQTGMLAGTPSFMSPEQTRGMELDPRSDLFSLGCVMYKLLTGKLPFSASTVLGTLQTIQSDSPTPPVAINPNCNSDLSDLTMSLLEKLPGNRLASAESLIACLGSDRNDWPIAVPTAIDGLDVASREAQQATRKPKPMPKVSRGPGNWITAVTLLGLFAIPGWLFAPQIYRFATDQGELVIETSDRNVKVQVLENGNLFRVLDASSKDSFDIRSGEYSFNVVGVDSKSEFEITPQSVIMTRGGKQIVSVTMPSRQGKLPESGSETDSTTAQAETLRVQTAAIQLQLEQQIKDIKNVCIAYKLQVGSYPKTLDDLVRLPEGMTAAQWGGPYFQDAVVPKDPWNNDFIYSADEEQDRVSVSSKGPDESMVTARVSKKPERQMASSRDGLSDAWRLKSENDRIDRTYGSSNTPEKRRATLEATIAALNVERDQLLDRLGSGHPTVQKIDKQIESIRTRFGPLVATTEQPIYGGRTFDQWRRIAEYDREPKTVADAIAACATLANEEQKPNFLNLFRHLIRQHGVAHSSPMNSGVSGGITPSRIMFTGFIRALGELEPDEIVDLMKTEIESGNERSLGCCSCVTGYIDFEDYQKSAELYEQLHFDITPILKRVTKGELKFDSNIQAFLDFALTNRIEKPELDSVTEFIKAIDVADRPMVYGMLMKSLKDGELDEMVAADFFDKGTTGETRSQLLFFLSTNSMQFVHSGGVGNSAIGAEHAPKMLELLNRLLLRSIKSHFTKGESKLEKLDFGIWDEIWLGDEGLIRTVRNADGTVMWLQNGSYSSNEPKGAKSFQGRVAIVRHLLTKLCQNVLRQKDAKDHEAIATFATDILDHEKLKDIASEDQTESLSLEHDLETLLRVVRGEDASGDFSSLVKQQDPANGGAFGGGGGRGGGGMF